MYANFKTVVLKFFSQFARNPVATFWNKIERGAKTSFHLQSHHVRTLGNASRALHVVCEYDSEDSLNEGSSVTSVVLH